MDITVQVIYFISFGIIEPILVILKIEYRISRRYGVGRWSVCSFANYIVAYEEIQSNRVSDFVCSLFPKAILFYFYFTLLLVLCRVEAVKSLPVQHHSAGYNLFPLGTLSPSWLFWKSNTAQAGARGVCSLANYSVAYEEILSIPSLWFRDSVCSLFPKVILFDIYLPGIVPCGSRKKSPRTLS